MPELTRILFIPVLIVVLIQGAVMLLGDKRLTVPSWILCGAALLLLGLLPHDDHDLLPILLYALPAVLLLRGLALLLKDRRWAPLAWLPCAVVLWLIVQHRPSSVGLLAGLVDLIFIIGGLIVGLDLFLSLLALRTSRRTALALGVSGYVMLCLMSYPVWNLGWEAFSRELNQMQEQQAQETLDQRYADFIRLLKKGTDAQVIAALKAIPARQDMATRPILESRRKPVIAALAHEPPGYDDFIQLATSCQQPPLDMLAYFSAELPLDRAQALLQRLISMSDRPDYLECYAWLKKIAPFAALVQRADIVDGCHAGDATGDRDLAFIHSALNYHRPDIAIFLIDRGFPVDDCRDQAPYLRQAISNFDSPKLRADSTAFFTSYRAHGGSLTLPVKMGGWCEPEIATDMMTIARATDRQALAALLLSLGAIEPDPQAVAAARATAKAHPAGPECRWEHKG